MKPFTLQLAELNDGSTAAALTADFSELLASVMNTGRGGALTIKVKVAPATKNNGGSVDKVTVLVERVLALPKPEAPVDFFWLTDDAQMTRHHPRQNSLDLRDVTSGDVNLGNFKEAT